MEEFLAYIGIVSLIGGFGWLGYWLFKRIEWKNPIKSYIRKEVINYLEELRND